MAVIVREDQRLTSEDLASSAGIPEKFVELVEGELIVMTPAGRFHNVVASNIEHMFREFCQERAELTFGGDNEGFLVKRNYDTVFSPDACLFRRRPDLHTTWLEFAPEIAVEVLSPSNSPAEMVYKRKTYFDAGTEQFWLVDPEKGQIEIHYRGGHVVTITGDEVIEGEGIAAGMQISLPEIFEQR